MLRIQLDSQTYPRLFGAKTYIRINSATLFFLKWNAQLCNPAYTKKTKSLCAGP
jgi:hypothetical protein